MISRMFRGDDKNAAVKRKRQIDTLKIFNDNVVELREDAEYHVHFDAGDVRMAIIVTLSPEFPLEKPVITVSPAVIHHPWCNEHSEIVNAPGLINFTVHSDLGRVVQVIIREFIKNPPLQSHEDTVLSASNTLNRTELLNGTLLCGSQCYPNLYSVDHNSSKFSSASANICKYDYVNECPLDDERTAFASTSSRPIYMDEKHQHRQQHSTNLIHNVANSITATTANTTATNTTTTVTTTTTTTVVTISTTAIITTICSATTIITATASTATTNTTNNHNQYFSNRQTTDSITSTCYSTNANYSPLMTYQAPTFTIVNVEFPELNCLSNEKLIELDEDNHDNNRDVFLYEFSRLNGIHSSIDETIDRVEKLANENLSRENEIKTLQDEVASKIQSVSALKMRFDNLIQRYNKLSQAFAPDHIKECLKYAADDSHEQSERIAESFLEGRIDVERFLNTYIECRKLGQARRTKEEKLAHQLHEFKRAGY